jgi:hypothetical protein
MGPIRIDCPPRTHGESVRVHLLSLLCLQGACTISFNHLLLPEYSSLEKLRERLAIAIDHSEGFGTREVVLSFCTTREMSPYFALFSAGTI